MYLSISSADNHFCMRLNLCTQSIEKSVSPMWYFKPKNRSVVNDINLCIFLLVVLYDLNDEFCDVAIE